MNLKTKENDSGLSCDCGSAHEELDRRNAALANAEEVFARPAYRTEREENAFRAKVYLPGVSRNALDVSFNAGVLTVTGRRGATRVPESWRPIHEELGKPDYRLRLRLNDEIDEARIGAKIEDGVLILTLPFQEAVKPRMIKIES